MPFAVMYPVALEFLNLFARLLNDNKAFLYTRRTNNAQNPTQSLRRFDTKKVCHYKKTNKILIEFISRQTRNNKTNKVDDFYLPLVIL